LNGNGIGAKMGKNPKLGIFDPLGNLVLTEGFPIVLKVGAFGRFLPLKGLFRLLVLGLPPQKALSREEQHNE
jgi:hypothetical protein